MAPASHADRELRFVAVSGTKSTTTTDRKERSSVRAFVMRDYLRQKSDSTWEFTPAKVADRITSHISRFRSSRPSEAPKTRRRKPLAGSSTRLGDKRRPQRPLVPALFDSGAQSSALPSSSISTLFDPDKKSPSLPSPHDLNSFDPFSTFAADLGGSESQSLLQYYQTAFWANSYACNPEARWISVALMDPAMIHATLSLVAIHRRDCYSIDLTRVYFKHRGEALKIIASRLNNDTESLSDETIGAVALLSSSDNHFDWPSDAQTTHSTALSQLIVIRGGMRTLNSNRHIQRVAGWAAMLQSALHGTALQVEMPEAVQTASESDINLEVKTSDGEGLPQGIVLQDLPTKIGARLRQLRILSSLKMSLLENREEELCRSFSNLLWKLEHSILDTPNQDKPRKPTRNALLSDVVSIAVLMFSYLKLRDLAAPILYKRLSSRLQHHYSSLISALEYKSEEYLEDDVLAILLWSLFLGYRTTRNDVEGQAWFIGQMAELCWRHGILSLDTFRGKIQAVVPQACALLDVSEDSWTPVEDSLWSGMLSFDGGVASRGI